MSAKGLDRAAFRNSKCESESVVNFTCGEEKQMRTYNQPIGSSLFTLMAGIKSLTWIQLVSDLLYSCFLSLSSNCGLSMITILILNGIINVRMIRFWIKNISFVQSLFFYFCKNEEISNDNRFNNYNYHSNNEMLWKIFYKKIYYNIFAYFLNWEIDFQWNNKFISVLLTVELLKC